MGRDSEGLLRTVLDHAPVTLFSLDEHGVLTLAEGRALAMSGKRGVDVVGTQPLERFAAREEVVGDIRRALSGEEFTAEREVDGAILETHFRPLREDGGRVVGTVGVSVDVTARRRAEAERSLLQAQLLRAQNLESLGVLAGGIAHDFNNLLTAILANASAALGDPRAPSATQKLEDVVLAAQRAADLARKLLAYAGRASVEVQDIELSEHVGEMARLLRPALPSGVELSLNLANETLFIEADVAQLQQLVMNLVVNGAEAVSEKIALRRGAGESNEVADDDAGKVSIATFGRDLEAGEAADLMVPGGRGPLPAGRYAVLRIRDTGIGMDAATRARIFDPFFTTKLRGRGLGLATVLGVVRSHQGALRADSVPGRGTTLEAWFPARSNQAAQAKASLPTSGARADGYETPTHRPQGTVLIVDDEDFIRKASARILEDCGFRTLLAAGGRQGVELFQAHADEIVVVLLDMTMPDQTGEQTLRELRRYRSDIPVVLSSGYDEADARVRVGADPHIMFLQKPYAAADLTRKIQGALESNR